MPPRTSTTRTRRRSPVASAPSPSRTVPAIVGHDARISVAHHGVSITILWVLMVCMCIAVWLVMLVVMFRLDQLEVSINGVQQQIVAQQVQAVVPDILPVVPVVPSTPSVPLIPVVSMSPSGALDRGSLSVDGTKYAGYDSSTKGKIGIAVEIVGTKQVKHIIIFDTRAESTGSGTPSESALSVRWQDAQTIEYDSLIKKGKEWVKEIRTAKIFF